MTPRSERCVRGTILLFIAVHTWCIIHLWFSSGVNSVTVSTNGTTALKLVIDGKTFVPQSNRNMWEALCLHSVVQEKETVCFPSWIIVGAGKSGSSAFWKFLCKDPTHRCKRKEFRSPPNLTEVQILHYNYGVNFGHAIGSMGLPQSSLRSLLLKNLNVKYFYILRNPIDHLYSAWNYWCFRKIDNLCDATHNLAVETRNHTYRSALTFDLIINDLCLGRDYDEKIIYSSWPSDDCPFQWPWRHHLDALRYKEELNDKLMVIRTEDLYGDPQGVMFNAYRFLELPLHGYHQNCEFFSTTHNIGGEINYSKSYPHNFGLGASYPKLLSSTRHKLEHLLRIEVLGKQFDSALSLGEKINDPVEPCLGV